MIVKKPVPFYPQKWDLSKWQELDFASYEEAQYWEKSSCGILCLKMAIDYFLTNESKPSSPSISEYIKEGLKINAFSDAQGWLHKGLVRLATKFGCSAMAHGHVSSKDLQKMVGQNELPIVSIRWAFLSNKSLKEKIFFWKRFGGHLALVVGFEGDNKNLEGFYVHHTSTVPEYNWQFKFIPLKQFEDSFTGRCISVKG